MFHGGSGGRLRLPQAVTLGFLVDAGVRTRWWSASSASSARRTTRGLRSRCPPAGALVAGRFVDKSTIRLSWPRVMARWDSASSSVSSSAPCRVRWELSMA